VHSVTDAQRAEALIRGLGISLDPGELDLWARAITRRDAWILCGVALRNSRCSNRSESSRMDFVNWLEIA
jgi:hypothetical protein